jgi:hypothetical protein
MVLPATAVSVFGRSAGITRKLRQQRVDLGAVVVLAEEGGDHACGDDGPTAVDRRHF